MKSITLKANSKINLSLDVDESQGGYHALKSVVTTVDLFDKIKITKRKDKKIILSSDIRFCPYYKDNAYICAKKFQEQFDTLGVDIKIEKGIPLSGGMGGSSADIAGVIFGMETLFDLKGQGKDILTEMASDAYYLYNGGFAVMSGRGNEIEKINSNLTLYFLLIENDFGIKSGDCFSSFDNLKIKKEKEYTPLLKEGLEKGDITLISENVYNDLYLPATKLNEKLTDSYLALEKLNPIAFSMTGSGSSVFALFLDKSSAEKGKDLLSKKYKTHLIKSVPCGVEIVKVK